MAGNIEIDFAMEYHGLPYVRKIPQFGRQLFFQGVKDEFAGCIGLEIPQFVYATRINFATVAQGQGAYCGLVGQRVAPPGDAVVLQQAIVVAGIYFTPVALQDGPVLATTVIVLEGMVGDEGEAFFTGGLAI
jgi:hypothetical protein